MPKLSKHQNGSPKNKKRASRPPSYATYNQHSEVASSSSEYPNSDELYESDYNYSKSKMAGKEASSSSSKGKGKAKSGEVSPEDQKTYKEVYPEDKKEKFDDVYPEDKKEPPRKYCPLTPVFEAYPEPPPPPQVTFIRPRRVRSSCVVMGLVITLALSLTLNFIWITVALNRSIGPGFPGFNHHPCDCSKADTPAINFSPQIEVHPAQAAADASAVTVTSISTLTTTTLSSSSASSESPTSTTVVTVTPHQSTVNSTTIITATPRESDSPRSTVYSTTVITASPTGKDAPAPSAASSTTLTMQQGRIPDNSALPDAPPSSTTFTTVTVTPKPGSKTIGEANHSLTSLTACESAVLHAPDGAAICP